MRDAGGSKELIRQALRYKCPLCESEKRLGQRSCSILPIRARHFNAVVVMDVATILLQRLDSPDVTIKVLGMIDS